MDIDQLFVMQESLRNPLQIPEMIDYVKHGGRWVASALESYGGKADMINISCFPDGKKMIHDGHHRVVATLLAGRSILYPEEYFVRDWMYEDYECINIESKYLTPHDPRIHVRLADFSDFREKLKKAESPIDFIKENPHMYRKNREIWTVRELIDNESLLKKI